MSRSLRTSAIFSVTVVIVLVCPFIGVRWIPPEVALGPLSTTEAHIFWNIRVPRVALGFLSGASLAIAGMVFQALFRNPLATPYTLGVASGAALGAAIYVKFLPPFDLPWLPGGTVSAFLGALLSVMTVLTLGIHASTLTLLLSGVVLSFFFSSLIMLVQYVSDSSQVFQMTRWLMGSMDVVGYELLFALTPFIVLAWFVVLLSARSLDLLALGEELAVSRGVNLHRTRVILFLAVSVLVACVVSVSGPIGFIGIVVPFLARYVVGTSHHFLFWGCLIIGGGVLCVCDAAGRFMFAPTEIPVGVITALLGAPLFVWILRTSR